MRGFRRTVTDRRASVRLNDIIEKRPNDDFVPDSNVKSEHEETTIKNRHIHSWLLLSAIVAVSLRVRVAALAYWQAGAIENEGAEYARPAEDAEFGAYRWHRVDVYPSKHFSYHSMPSSSRE